ncbi:unnamed protein product [Polarella glacialis]|uniref:Uncharacterized protein n=1 Tax=Polarella glacialis TaxID=89957 RepID=A0A813H258_POLGL|nr:unnamed protein product [Polarella glacialis]
MLVVTGAIFDMGASLSAATVLGGAAVPGWHVLAVGPLLMVLLMKYMEAGAKVDMNAMRRQKVMKKKRVLPVKKAMMKVMENKNGKKLWCTRSSAICSAASSRTS